MQVLEKRSVAMVSKGQVNNVQEICKSLPFTCRKNVATEFFF